MRHFLIIGFAVDGDLRFISHHDTLRMFERALARAAVPVKFSEGFNPRPRISLPLPRAVGIASEDERLVVECTEAIAPEALLLRLARQMPAGVTLRQARWLEENERRTPSRATYRLDVTDESLAADLPDRVARLCAAERALVQRRDHKTGATRTIDVRPCLLAVRVEGGRVEWTQSMPAQGGARPGEVLESLGLPPGEHLHRVRRTAVCYS